MHRSMSVILCAFALLSSGKINAEETISIIPSVGILEKKLDFEQKQTGTLKFAGNFSAMLPMLDLSLTTGYGKWFLTLKYDHAFTDVSVNTDEESVVTGSGSRQYFWETPGAKMQVDREDKNITLGYNAVAGLNVFIGYMDSETTLFLPPSCADPYTYASPPTQIYCQTYNFSWLRLRESNNAVPRQVLDRYTQAYSEEGPYVGMSYAWNVLDAGTLSLSAAYAEMNGNFKDNMQLTALNFLGFDADGDVKGSSYGITWIQALTEGTSYFIDMRQQSYKMEAIDQSTGQIFDTREIMTGLSVGMQFYF